MQLAGKTYDSLTPDGIEITDQLKIRSALASILESHAFSSSKQCRDLLSYVVEQSLLAETGVLRERVIGIEVFGRPANYNTSEDPVVRMRAADVRKRLAQYYQSADEDNSLPHIELHPGSYRATFRVELQKKDPSPPTATSAEPLQMPQVEIAPTTSLRPAKVNFWVIAASVVLLVVAAIGAQRWLSLRVTPLSMQQKFWAPLLSTDKPALIYLGANAAYIFTPEFLNRYQLTHKLDQNGPEFFVDLTPHSSISTDDLRPVQNSFVTVGDLAATTQLTTLLNGFHQRFVLRSAADVSFGDLRNTPTVLVGGFNNRWTLAMTKDLPYSFKDGTRIVERGHPEHFWIVKSSPMTPSYDDFAVISRLVQSKTGAPSMIVAGIGQNGTQAAAEFLADPERVTAALRQAPKGWEAMNIQIVLRVGVIDYLPSVTEVIGTSYW